MSLVKDLAMKSMVNNDVCSISLLQYDCEEVGTQKTSAQVFSVPFTLTGARHLHCVGGGVPPQRLPWEHILQDCQRVCPKYQTVLTVQSGICFRSSVLRKAFSLHPLEVT